MNSASVFLNGIDAIELPIAHAEGKVVVRHDSVLAGWRERRQIALAYQPGTTTPTARQPILQ